MNKNWIKRRRVSGELAKDSTAQVHRAHRWQSKMWWWSLFFLFHRSDRRKESRYCANDSSQECSDHQSKELEYREVGL